ncbi:MAG: GIY-YIG nuclease family protein [Bacteroidetes bacterium]|nr:GIY-YIG nuclease family protein [Bacteroidota bacterium]
MTNNELETKILTTIKAKRTFQKSFSDLVKDFEIKFANFDPTANCFEIGNYFGARIGQVAATKKLIADGKIKSEWLREYETKSGKTKNDFIGLYVFLNDNCPFYVGISKGVIGRIFQHTKGHNHNTSTLAYNIGLIRYELLTGQKHLGDRKELNFKTEVEPVKEFLLRQKIALLPIDNHEELYLFEIFCSMKLQTFLNKFETH